MDSMKILLRIGIFILWTWPTPTTSYNYQIQTDYRLRYNNNPATIMPLIYQRCKAEAAVPMAVALGHLEQWDYMCSHDYFKTCQTELPVALTTIARLNPYERDYVMSNFNAWVKGGAPYLCNAGQISIRNLMDSGGRTCLTVTASSRIRQCDEQLRNIQGGISYSDDYCRDWDDAFQCYIDAVNTCSDDPLADFLWDFFENVMYMGPCEETSRFTNAATDIIINKNLVILLTILSVMIKLFL
ncbi:hypothetical protein CHUAL_013387 [Chamberlinius hualienensis]